MCRFFCTNGGELSELSCAKCGFQYCGNCLHGETKTSVAMIMQSSHKCPSCNGNPMPPRSDTFRPYGSISPNKLKARRRSVEGLLSITRSTAAAAFTIDAALSSKYGAGGERVKLESLKRGAIEDQPNPINPSSSKVVPSAFSSRWRRNSLTEFDQLPRSLAPALFKTEENVPSLNEKTDFPVSVSVDNRPANRLSPVALESTGRALAMPPLQQQQQPVPVSPTPTQHASAGPLLLDPLPAALPSTSHFRDDLPEPTQPRPQLTALPSSSLPSLPPALSSADAPSQPLPTSLVLSPMTSAPKPPPLGESLEAARALLQDMQATAVAPMEAAVAALAPAPAASEPVAVPAPPAADDAGDGVTPDGGAEEEPIPAAEAKAADAPKRRRRRRASGPSATSRARKTESRRRRTSLDGSSANSRLAKAAARSSKNTGTSTMELTEVDIPDQALGYLKSLVAPYTYTTGEKTGLLNIGQFQHLVKDYSVVNSDLTPNDLHHIFTRACDSSKRTLTFDLFLKVAIPLMALKRLPDQPPETAIPCLVGALLNERAPFLTCSQLWRKFSKPPSSE